MRIVAVLLLSLALSGCATIPAIPTAPARGQSLHRYAADEKDCARETAKADKRDTEYAACMIARGYRATVRAGTVGTASLFVNVTADRDQKAVREDVLRCRLIADAAIKADEGKAIAARVALGLLTPLAGLAGIPTETDLLTRIQGAFTTCMEGYIVTRWESTR